MKPHIRQTVLALGMLFATMARSQTDPGSARPAEQPRPTATRPGVSAGRTALPPRTQQRRPADAGARSGRLQQLQQLRRDYHLSRRGILEKENALREKDEAVRDRIAEIDQEIAELYRRIRELEASKQEVYTEADKDLAKSYQTMSMIEEQIEALRTALYPIRKRSDAPDAGHSRADPGKAASKNDATDDDGEGQ